jgi:ABC-2 type transport system permease protein
MNNERVNKLTNKFNLKRSFALTKRNLIEMALDPISLVFCVGVPIVMLVFLELILSNVGKGVAMFNINLFAPAVCNFGFTFTMLYVALMISGDRSSAFMSRLLVSPLKTSEYLLSYVLAFLPVSIVQTILFYGVSFIFGLSFSANTILSIVYLIPSALFYCVVGILIGTIAKSDKQAGPISSLTITGSGLLGGIWLPLTEIGGVFFEICKYLPFYNGVYVGQAPIFNHYDVLIEMAILFGYILLVGTIAVWLFKYKTKGK